MNVVEPRRRSVAALCVLAILALAAFAGLWALGTWQVQRRAWKLALIAQVRQRVDAPAVAAPGPSTWPTISAASDAYRHVRVTGVFLNGLETRVQALSELGAGYWVLTPLHARQGFTVLVNRGFVPADRADPASRVAGQRQGPTTVSGLLRVSEPGGAFLRRNDPVHDLWYSRDVAAIARKRGVADAAPYFIDADATANPGGLPVGGLTVVSFSNSHLMYAATWYALALMVAGGAGFIAREEWRARRPAPPQPEPEPKEPDSSKPGPS